jgi:2-dehydro-3-deoxy-D-gluconate 5-dehydrogenase
MWNRHFVTRQKGICGMNLSLFSLEGKVALVTGGNKGLGQGIAFALAQAGADIAVAGRMGAAETRAKVESLGRRFISIDADLTSLEPIDRIVAETLSGLGRLDILVNNAGIIRRQDAVNFSEQDWDDVMNVNVKSAFFLCQAAGKVMIEQGSGKIINIASMLSFQGGIRVPSYTASKSGIAGITKLLACEWAGKGLNINAIAPGYMATDNTAQLRADQERSVDILKRIPAGRWGSPDDLGGTAIFLASRASDYLNGAVIPVDGGWLAR